MAAGDKPTNPAYHVTPNADYLQVTHMEIARINTPIKGPDFPVPEGYQLMIQSDPRNAALNFIFVSDRAAAPPMNRDVIILVPGATLPLHMKNPNTAYFSGTSVGDFIIFWSEKVKTTAQTRI